MGTLNKLRDLKRWVPLHPLRGNTAAGVCMIDGGPDQAVLIFAGATSFWYSPLEDAVVTAAAFSPALGGTFGAGACGRYHPAGPAGTAQAGSNATTLVTNLSLLADLRPVGDTYFTGFVTGGAGAGQEFRIVSNTNAAGASVLAIEQPTGGALAVALNATSTYQLYTGTYYVLNAGTLATSAFRAFDWATKSWNAGLSITGLPASWGTDGRMVVTPSRYATFATLTATGGSTTMLAVGGSTWTANVHTRKQVRCISGANAGAIRTVASNTADTLTLATALPTAVLSGDVWKLEGNDDDLYLMGNNTVAAYRYSRSANTWTTLAPGAARAGAPVAGMSLNWVHSVSTPEWASLGLGMNGRYLYSLRGGGGNIIDRYDMALNTWASDIAYGNKAETFGTGSSAAYIGDRLYIDKDATGLIFALDLPSLTLVPIAQWLVLQGAAVVGDKLCAIRYTKGGNTADWLYKWNNTQASGQRLLLV